MTSYDDTPIFNLKAVVKETDLKPDTLRAWERRYGIPNPERTPGGHRLYSQRDIETLKWLLARQSEGMSIGRATDLWRRLIDDGSDPLAMPEYADAPAPSRPAPVMVDGSSLTEYRDAWVEACLEFDEYRAENIVSQAFAIYSPEIVTTEVLRKGLQEIGEGWYAGRISVQQEHFASALALRRLEAMVSATPQPTRSERILIGCPPHEDHAFSPLMLSLFLKRRGYNVIYLGANVPVGQLAETVEATQVDLVVMAAQQLHTAASLQEVADLLDQRDVPLAYGGMIFTTMPELTRRVTGHYLGDNLEDAPDRIENLLHRSRSAEPATPVSAEHHAAWEHFRARQPHIEADVWDRNGAIGLNPELLTMANESLSRNISAALMLGNIDYLGHEIDWVRDLLLNYHIPYDQLHHYLAVYHEAAHTHLGESGSVIVDWLAELTA